MSITRRDLLAGVAALGAVRALPKVTLPPRAGRKPFRLVHFTDTHVQPEMNAPWGMRKALRHAMALDPKPDMVVTGGDLIMDSFAAPEERTKKQWEVFDEVMKAECHVPAYHTLGNHDVWGWDKNRSKTSGNEPLWGKTWFTDRFGYEKTYQAVDAGAWRLLILDTVLQTPDGYNGFIEDDQLAWTKTEIEKTDRPVVIVSHIPLIAPCTMVHGYNKATGEWNVGGDAQTKNFDEVRAIFDKNPQVKLCLSGHIHLVDRYDYNGVSYLCSGAVCGRWWTGRLRYFDPGYVAVDLNEDGTWSHVFHTWGWNARGRDE